MTWQWNLLGRTVEVAASPRWVWRFDPAGVRLVTDSPGGPWPDGRVTHTFTRQGNHPVGVEATWTAHYVVDGIGPLVVEQPITQSAVMTVQVGQARAVLIR